LQMYRSPMRVDAEPPSAPASDRSTLIVSATRSPPKAPECVEAGFNMSASSTPGGAVWGRNDETAAAVLKVAEKPPVPSIPITRPDPPNTLAKLDAKSIPPVEAASPYEFWSYVMRLPVFQAQPGVPGVQGQEPTKRYSCAKVLGEPFTKLRFTSLTSCATSVENAVCAPSSLFASLRRSRTVAPLRLAGVTPHSRRSPNAVLEPCASNC